jgi:hypothetical protein
VRRKELKDHEPQAGFSGDEVFIIGAGHFGKRAVDLLSQRFKAPLWVVEKDEEALRFLGGLPIERILHDAVPFLVSSFHLLHPKNVIVPAVPLHLAYEWLRLSMKGDFRVFQIEVPETIKPLLPHTWEGNEGSLLVSYADFRCPDDCPEPADHCTVTGKKRGTPLHALLSDIALPGYRIHVLRSRQLAPGVGGYTVGDLQELLRRVESGGKGKWLVATACKCHGVVSAMEITGKKSETIPKSQCSKLKTK